MPVLSAPTHHVGITVGEPGHEEIATADQAALHGVQTHATC